MQPTSSSSSGGGGGGTSSGSGGGISSGGSVFVEGQQRVVLAAAQSCVRTHCETDVMVDDESADLHGISGISFGGGIAGGGGGGGIGGSDIAGAGGGIGSSGAFKNGSGIGGGPITLCGESSFPTPVVACTFHEPLSAVTLLRQYRPRHVIEGDPPCSVSIYVPSLYMYPPYICTLVMLLK